MGDLSCKLGRCFQRVAGWGPAAFWLVLCSKFCFSQQGWKLTLAQLFMPFWFWSKCSPQVSWFVKQVLFVLVCAIKQFLCYQRKFNVFQYLIVKGFIEVCLLKHTMTWHNVITFKYILYLLIKQKKTLFFNLKNFSNFLTPQRVQHKLKYSIFYIS